MKRIQFTTFDVVAIGIGAALYGFLGLFSFPIAFLPNCYLKPALAFLSIYAALFGPFIGFFIGFIGNIITDLFLGGIIWWGWVLGSAIMGFGMGLINWNPRFSIKYGTYSFKHLVFLILLSEVGIVLGMLEATLFDVHFMNEPAKKMMVQFFGAVASNTLILFVLSLPIVVKLLKMNQKSVNLRMEVE